MSGVCAGEMKEIACLERDFRNAALLRVVEANKNLPKECGSGNGRPTVKKECEDGAEKDSSGRSLVRRYVTCQVSIFLQSFCSRTKLPWKKRD